METRHDDPPWSIPIREAGPDIPQRAATWADRVPVLPVVLGAVALFAVVVASLVVLDGEPAESGPEVLSGEVVGSEVLGSEVLGSEVPPTISGAGRETSLTSITAAPTTTGSTTTTTPTATAPPEARPPAVAATDPEPADLPIHTPGDLGGGWVAQVSSVPTSAGGSALARSYETISRTVPDAIIVRGSEWASLRDGFWVILRAGYDDARSAVADCDRWGLDGRDRCFARFLSPDDDAQRTCWRDESGALAGDCR